MNPETQNTEAMLERVTKRAETLAEVNAELLEALKAILPVYKDWTEDGGHDPSAGIDATADWIRIENAEAAIAKAEGTDR